MRILSPFRRERLAAAVLLLLMAILAGGAALRESVTIDEVTHIGAGVSYWQRLDLRMNVEHPPLAKLLAALPLVLRGVRADYSHFSWTFSERGFNSVLGQWSFGHWLITRWNDPVSTVAWGRAALLALTLALGWLLYRCGMRLADGRGGLLALSAFVSTPAFLAFGPLVLTDIAIAFFSLLTLWTLAELWRAPGRAAVARFALALAGALLSKFSAGLLLAACLAFGWSLHWLPAADQRVDDAQTRAWRRRGWRSTGKGILWAALLVYAVYLVFSWNQPSTNLAFLGSSPAALVLRRLLMPPLVFGSGLAAFAVTASRPTFLFGHTYPHGVWFYFPVIFSLKSTLAFLGLLLLALAVALAARRRLPANAGGIAEQMDLHWRAVWVFLLVFGAASLLSPMTISIRHFTVPLALLILMLAPLPRLLENLRQSGCKPAPAGAWLIVVLAGASLLTVVRAYPYYIPFLNSLSLGKPGYRLVNDSNLDWNQGLPEVREFALRRGLDRVLIDAYSFSEPEVYVPQAQWWNCQTPSPADGGHWAVVSANMILESHNCPWLLHYPHQSLAGGSMMAVELPAVIPGAGTPGGPPLPRDFHNLGGVSGSWPDLRLIFLRGIRDPQQLPAALQQLYALGPPGRSQGQTTAPDLPSQ